MEGNITEKQKKLEDNQRMIIGIIAVCIFGAIFVWQTMGWEALLLGVIFIGVNALIAKFGPPTGDGW